jgi:hypothetical protein
LDNGFLVRTPKAQVEVQINTWDDIKLKSFCPTKEIVNRRRKEPAE